MRAHETVDDLVRSVASPLVEQGLARLEWTDPDPEAEGAAEGSFELWPTNSDAAQVGVALEGRLVTLFLGPRGNSHEVWVDKNGKWEGHLRACLQAVVDGRYRESAAPGRVARQVVTMTFEMPGEEDVVVTHHVYPELPPGEQQPLAERRFASYS